MVFHKLLRHFFLSKEGDIFTQYMLSSSHTPIRSRNIFLTQDRRILAIFQSSGIWGIGKWQFVIPRGSRKLKPISRGSGLEYFWGVSTSDLNSILNFESNHFILVQYNWLRTQVGQLKITAMKNNPTFGTYFSPRLLG